MEGQKLLLAVISLFSLVIVAASGPPLQLDYNTRVRLSSKAKTSNRAPPAPFAENYLPKNVTPIHYDLFIRPILDVPGADDTAQRFTNPGEITILVNCVTATNVISLHRFDTLTIHDVKVSEEGTNATVPVVEKDSYDETNHFMSIKLGADLAAGKNYEVWISFTSILDQTSTDGLYLAKYTDDIGDEKLLATTQFESISARNAFPCFDEPSLKATFSIAIARNGNYNSLCNSAKVETGVTDPNHPLPTGYVWDKYKKTVVMSTYLIAIVVSNFACEAAPAGIFPKPVQVCGRPDWINVRKAGVFAAEASAKIINALEETFKFPYEMDKMDSIAVPRAYFGAGAMENWGLNTYQDRYLLFFQGESTVSTENSILSILGHELAHQWFGNLLTCHWWSNIWLNEGFATYVAAYIQNKVFPDFDTRRELLIDSVQNAMSYDVNRNAPIVNSAETINEVDNVFGTITYDKGGSIIRMMEGFLGNDTLLNGLVEYLRRFNYTGVQQDQLFQVLTEHAHADKKIPDTVTIKDIMDTWTLQSGYPLIRVSKASSDRLIISQEEFRPLSTSASQNTNSKLDPADLWTVPITVANDANPDFTNTTPAFWLPKSTAMTTYKIDTTKWLVLNTGAYGYYRVLYDDELLKLIHAKLQDNLESVSELNRAQFIDDYFRFYKAGHMSADRALEFTKYLIKDADHIVWNTVFSHFTSWVPLLSTSNDFKDYMVPRVEAALSTIGYEDIGSQEKGSRVLFRNRLYDWANALGSSAFRQKAWNLVYMWQVVGDAAAVRLDYHPTVFCAAVAQTEEAFNFFLQKYKDATTDELKTKYINALACSSDAGVIRRFHDLTLVNTEIRKEDVVNALDRSARNSDARPLLLAFLRSTSNFETLANNLGDTKFADTLLTTASAASKSQAEKDLLLQIVEDYKGQLGNPDALRNTITQNVDSNIRWFENEGNALVDWFKKANSE